MSHPVSPHPPTTTPTSQPINPNIPLFSLVTPKSLKLATIVTIIAVITAATAFYSYDVLTGQPSLPTLVGFDYEEAYSDLKALTQIGPRVPGTPEDLAGAEYVQSRFSEAGLSNVHIEEHQVTVRQ